MAPVSVIIFIDALTCKRHCDVVFGRGGGSFNCFTLLGRFICNLVSCFKNWHVAKSESAQHLQNAAPGVLPNITCSYLNTTVQVVPEQRPLTERHLSCFRCYMQKIRALTPELSSNLSTISQYTQSMERLMRDRINQLGCRLPTFENDVDKYEYVGGLLQLLDQRLKETKFWFHCKVTKLYLFIYFKLL